jgi:hypothetical protein
MMHGKQHGDSWTQDRRGMARMDGVTVETKAAGNVLYRWISGSQARNRCPLPLPAGKPGPENQDPWIIVKSINRRLQSRQAGHLKTNGSARDNARGKARWRKAFSAGGSYARKAERERGGGAAGQSHLIRLLALTGAA